MNDDINNSLSQQDGLFGRAEPQFNISKWLMQQAEPEEEPVSLDNLKQDEIDKIMTAVKNGREIAKTYYEGTVEPELIERQKLRRADKLLYKKKFPNLTEYSKFVSMDFNNTVEWIKPSLVEVFIGTESPVTIAGANIQNDDTATKMQQLVEYQLTRKNSYTSMVHDVIDDALSVNIGVCKAWWKREEKRDRYKMMFDVADMQTAMMLTQASMSGEIEIQSIKPLKDATDLYEVQFDRVQVTANYPVVEYVPPSELRYTPEGSNLQECKFVAHRKIVKGDYLKRKEQEGIYQNVDEALEHTGDANYTDDDIYHNETLNKGKMKTDDGDDASKDVELYECYVDVDYNNDGIYEHLIVHCVGDTALSIQTNEFNIAPFFSIPGIRDSRKIFSDRSLAEEIEGLQDIKTALVKQLIINVAKTNDQQKFIDYQKIVDPDAMLSGDEYVACQGDPNAAIYMPPQAPVSPLTMDLINYAEAEIQNRSGSTKYNQGLDADSLNKMLALDTPIPLSDGTYKKNKDIVAGDMVIGSNGKPTRVIVAHPIKMPKRAFKITFATGDVIKAGGEHRWGVKICDKWGHHKSKEFEKLPTERIYDLMQQGYKAYIPRAKNVDFTEKELPISPYVFGAWLGDGHAHTNRFTSMDSEVVDEFKKWASRFYGGCIKPCKIQHSGKAVTYSIVNTPFRTMLKDLGVLKDSRYEETKHNVKHIPDIYLQGSFEQRLALLRGLMDTDGCITKDGQSIFCNSEESLINDVVKLIHSFGLRATVKWTNIDAGANKYKHARPHAHIYFSSPFCPVTIKHKAERWRTKPDNKWLQQRIVSMEEIPVEPMRCLTVAAKDELYCCGNIMTVTSNTATGITAIMGAADKRIKLMARLIAENWTIPMVRFIILLNKKYGEPIQTFRYKDAEVSINNDDLDIDYDFVINVGNGAGTKEARIQSYMLLLSNVYPILAQVGVATPKSYYAAGTALLEEMGLKNTQEILLDPDSEEAKAQQAQQAQQTQQQALAMQQVQQQAQMALKQADIQGKIAVKATPSISADIKDLPVDAQTEIINKATAGNTNQQDVAMKEVLNNVR